MQKPPLPPDPEPRPRSRRPERMNAAGMTLRQIAFITGLSQDTIYRTYASAARP